MAAVPFTDPRHLALPGAAAAGWRARFEQLGVNPLSLRLLLAQLLLLAVTAPLYPLMDLTHAWRTLVPRALWLMAAAAVWFAYATMPGRSRLWPVVENVFALMLLITFSMLAVPAQYLAVAFKRPLADPWLARADLATGISVPALVTWTMGHPWLRAGLVAAYQTFQPEMILPLVVLGCVYRDRARVWEYAFHIHFCTLLTVIASLLWPAEGVFTYYGFPSLLDQRRFIAHFHGLRDGTLTVLNHADLEGMISFPSFHVAGALIGTWAFRRYPYWLAAVGLLNVALCASTVLLGAHYAIDIVGALALFAASLAAYRWWGERLLNLRRDA